MRLLLDTHIVIWALIDSPRLGAKAVDLISSRDHDLFVSAVSVWEIALKHGTGRADAPPFSGWEAIKACGRAGYEILAITAAHAAATRDLSDIHRDPFDRLLVAQARSEPMRLLTHDAKLAAFGEAVLLV